MLQGQFRFSDEFILNIKNEPKEQRHIIIHEYVHKKVSSLSTVGMLLIMMEKASIIDDDKVWLLDELIKMSNRMQEEVATTIEYLWILKKFGYDEFINEVNKLRDNKTYYKHFQNVYKYIPEDMLKKDTDLLIQKILLAAIISSNIDLNYMNFSEFSHEKDLQRFLSAGDNSTKFNINTRFKILLKYILQNSEKKRYNLVSSVSCNLENNFEMCFFAIKKIYYNSPNLQRILIRVRKLNINNSIKVTTNNLEALGAFPYEEPASSKKNNITTLTDVLDKLKNDKSRLLNFNHLLGGLEDIVLLYCNSGIENDRWMSSYNIEDIYNIISAVDNPIVFHQSKLYKTIKSNIKKLLPNRLIFIFMENAIGSSLSFIFEDFSNATYFVFDENKYDILAIFKENTILIQLCVKELKTEYEALFMDYNIKLQEVDNHMLVHESLIRRIAKIGFEECCDAIKNKSYGFR